MKEHNHCQYDVTIVGSGPSGTVLAYELAQQGCKVLIIEKNKLPRSKVCAGGITVRASLLLPFDFSQIVEDVIYGARLSYNFKLKKTRIYDKPLAYTVMREKFDYHLVSRACESGVTLVEGVEARHIDVDRDRVLVRTKSDTFSSSVLVGADGSNSVVVQSLGLKQGFEYGLALNSHISLDKDKVLEWDGLLGLDLGIPGGYAWVFPKQDCLSVGAGGSFRVARRLKPSVMRLIQAYNLGSVDPRLIRGHLMPLRRAKTPLSHPRVLLVGDAAGLIDPLSGEGIYYALKSSYLASGAIMRFIKGEATDLRDYEAAVDNELMPDLKAARTIQKINSAAPYLFSHLLNENDRVWRAFCRLLRGEKTYVDIKNFLSPPLRLIFRYF